MREVVAVYGSRIFVVLYSLSLALLPNEVDVKNISLPTRRFRTHAISPVRNSSDQKQHTQLKLLTEPIERKPPWALIFINLF